MFMCLRANKLTWCPAAWDLHIELDCVHAENGMAHMTEQIPCRHHPCEGRQLTQLSQLQLPPAKPQGGEVRCNDLICLPVPSQLYESV